MEILTNSVYFGVVLTLAAYWFGAILQKKFKVVLLNPILIGAAVVIGVLSVFRIEYETYNAGAKYLSYFLTPATVCLAVPLYEQMQALRKNWKAILTGIFSGVVTSMVTVLGLCAVFGLSHEEYVTFLPKSITTAIGMGVSEELGGNVNLTVAVIIFTGILGNIAAPAICKLFRVEEPVAKGVAVGTGSHAIGTARALTMGPVEGAMSSLSIAVSGLMTVVLASVFEKLF